jgi:hypothetical protein
MVDVSEEKKSKEILPQSVGDESQVSVQDTEDIPLQKRLIDFEVYGYIRNVYADLITKNNEHIPVLLRGVARKDRDGQRVGTYLILKSLADSRVGYRGDQLEAVQSVLKNIVTGDSDMGASEKANVILAQYSELNNVVNEVRKTIKDSKESVRILKAEKDKLAEAGYESGTAQEDCKVLEARLQKKIVRLEQLNELAIGRELKMIEMKEELEQLRGTKQAIG